MITGEASMMGLRAACSTQMLGPTSATCVTHQRPVRGLVSLTRERQPKRHESAMYIHRPSAVPKQAMGCVSLPPPKVVM